MAPKIAKSNTTGVLLIKTVIYKIQPTSWEDRYEIESPCDQITLEMVYKVRENVKQRYYYYMEVNKLS